MGFPKEFLWGASSSAFQIEGAALEDGKGLSQQDVLAKIHSEKTGFADASIASDHYHHFKEDVALMKECGFTSYRFSLSWPRIFPEGSGKVNAKGIQFYRNLIHELKVNGIEPIVTLYHYDTPMALVEKYDGWVSRQCIDDFMEYVSYVVNEFKNDVKYWTTFNETSIMVAFWKSKFYIRPELQNNEQLKYQINHHMNLAHAKTVKLIHELVPGGMVGPALGYTSTYPLTSKPADFLASLNAQEFDLLYFTDIYTKGIYNKAAMIQLEKLGLAPVLQPGDEELLLEGKSDFLAFNYYASYCAHACPEDAVLEWSGVNLSGKKGGMSGFETIPGFFQRCNNPNLETTDWDWTIDPMGLEHVLRDLYSRYNLPLMITENGMGAYDTLTEDGCIHDDYRIDYLKKHIAAIERALEYGVEMIGYNCWSAIDLLSTSNGIEKRYGLVYVDRTDTDIKECKRIPKDSYYWYKKVIASHGEDLE
ncbi:MAG: glycoside hydrolase family 1 protein [Coprobacillus sp.]|nr:glycoside hydrolase family 1 protein [Coprobacillus sp.]